MSNYCLLRLDLQHSVHVSNFLWHVRAAQFTWDVDRTDEDAEMASWEVPDNTIKQHSMWFLCVLGGGS